MDGDPELNQAFKPVGQFLFHWAYIEFKIEESIKSLLKIESPQGYIILANVSFRDKASILETLADYILLGDEPGQTEAHKLMKRIVSFSSNYRNILVHNPFSANGSDGIQIMRVRAKGKLDYPETIWTDKFFRERYAEIHSFSYELEQLTKKLVARDGVRRIAKVLSEPIPDSGGKGLLGHLMTHRLDSDDCPPPETTSEPNPQTPAAPDSKPEAE